MGSDIIPSYGMLTFAANHHIELGIGEKKLASVRAVGGGLGHAGNGNISPRAIMRNPHTQL
jgi:hypothetical protein